MIRITFLHLERKNQDLGQTVAQLRDKMAKTVENSAARRTQEAYNAVLSLLERPTRVVPPR